MHKVYNSQPGVARATEKSPPDFNYTNEFTNGICGCFSDVKLCLLTYFCTPCVAWCMFKDANEGCLTPFCCPNAFPMLRTKMRAQHRIDGAVWKDYCIFNCCFFCAMVQLANEMKIKGYSTFI